MTNFLKSFGISIVCVVALALLMGGLFLIVAGFSGTVVTVSTIVWGVLAFLGGLALFSLLLAESLT